MFVNCYILWIECTNFLANRLYIFSCKSKLSVAQHPGCSLKYRCRQTSSMLNTSISTSQQTDLFGIFVSAPSEAMNMDEWNQHEKDSPFKTANDVQDDVFNEILEKATEVMFISLVAYALFE